MLYALFHIHSVRHKKKTIKKNDSETRGSVASFEWLLHDSNIYKDMPCVSRRAYTISGIATLLVKKNSFH